MKRWNLSIVLFACFLALFPLASCGKKTPDNPDSIITEDQETEEGYNYNFNGKTLVILNSVNETIYPTSNRYIEGPESFDKADNNVDHAVYQRNFWMQERLNMNFQYINMSVGYEEASQTVERYLNSGTPIDLIISKLFPMANMSLEGKFINVANNSQFSFWEDYWYTDLMNDLSLDGGNTAFLMAGDYFMDVIQSANILIYNTQMMNDLWTEEGGDKAYKQSVLDGKWTLDDLITMVKNVAGDSTDSTKLGLAIDQYWAPMIPLIISSDLSFIKQTESAITVDMNMDKCTSLFEKMKNLFESDGTTKMVKDGDYVYNTADHTTALSQFDSKNALFIGGVRFGSLGIFTNSPVEWSVVPYPKFDKEQENYITPTHDTTEVGAIPTICTDQETVMTIIELLSKRTHQKVMPEYYDKMLKNRYGKDPVTAQLMDVIHDSMKGSFALAYSDYCDNALLWGYFYVPFCEGKTFSTAYSSLKQSTNDYLSEMLKTWNRITK